MSENIKELLDVKQKTHGDYKKTSRLAQQLKWSFQQETRGVSLTPEMGEAIDMICVKLARIASGDPCEIDHWIDISGYAQLVVTDLEKRRSRRTKKAGKKKARQLSPNET